MGHEGQEIFLKDMLVFLFAAGVIVPAFRVLKLPAVAGFLIAGADPWGMQLESGAIIGATLFGTCFGAWLGGLRGVSSQNHHLTPYLDRVEQGDYLMMVDADDDQQAGRVEKVMKNHRHEAEEAGREEHFSPFD